MPNKILTYADSNILIYAVSQKNFNLRLKALGILGDKRREYLASEFLRLETLPYAINAGRSKEVAFLQSFFNRHVSQWVEDERVLFSTASWLIERFNIQLMDALHLAAAMEYDADFVTGEKPTKPFHQAYSKCLWIADT
ncbi:MAG: type II toxin-antitoxin system VapC family toxin [Acidobacteria bacterium]|nr:type II toxin-antitoxin system VapC family toxin [Acidobacteriota bacterium]